MINNWFTQSRRTDKKYTKFGVYDYKEKATPNIDKIQSELKELIVENTASKDLLEAVARKYGWEVAYKKFIVDAQPKNLSIKKGKFGEILHGVILEEIWKYVIPLKKLQYGIARDSTLTGTDIYAVKTKDDKIQEICLIETKLRTYTDYPNAVESYNGLVTAINEKTPAILKFILKIVKKDNKNFFNMLLNYGIELQPRDKFRIGTIVESSEWSEKILENLEDEITHATIDLQVDVVRINNLEKLVVDTFKSIGVECVE